MLSIIVLLQVVLINFSFNISVKLFSLLLLSMTFYLFLPYSRRLIAAIFTNSTIKAIPTLANNKKQLFTLFLKCFIGGLFLLEGFYPYLNFGENKSAAPYLHGAYEVKKITILNEELTQPHFLYTHFFIHKNGYIIFEDSNRIMKDFALQYDTINQKLFLTDYKKNTTTLDYKYSDTDSTLILNYTLNNKPVTIFGKAIDWRKLPLLKDDFDWTSD
ncbi:MAG: hypothetical protein IPP48_00545 [Chitinophagaceae bacterium]|nr:hypothetical protein [Chitinophagaceae bacterium]